MKAKKKPDTKVQREAYHSRFFWIWWCRSVLFLMIMFVMLNGPHDYATLAPIPGTGCVLCWLWVWIHSQQEISCNVGEDDCKDDHTMGKVKKKTRIKRA